MTKITDTLGGKSLSVFAAAALAAGLVPATAVANEIQSAAEETPVEQMTAQSAAAEGTAEPAAAEGAAEPAAVEGAASATDRQGETREVQVSTYDALQGEINSLEDGSVADITLAGDIDIPDGSHVNIKSGVTVKLNFSGHTITKSDSSDLAPIENYGTLTLDGLGGIAGNNRCINSYGMLTVNGGAYTTTSNSGGTAIQNKDANGVAVLNGGTVNASFFAVYNYGTMTVNGGSYSSTACNHNGSWAYAFSSLGNLQFNQGAVTGVQGGLAVTDGTANIAGGTFRTKACESNPDNSNCASGMSAYYALYVAGESDDAEVIVHGGDFKSASRAAVHVGNNTAGDGGNRKHALLAIEGGTFTGGAAVNEAVAVDARSAVGELHISGGTFLKNDGSAASQTVNVGGQSLPLATYLAPTVKQNESGDVIARAETDADAVAKIGDDVYASFADAAANASANDTITLLSNVAGDQVADHVRFNVPVTLDLNGKTVDITKALMFHAGPSAIKNGTVKSTMLSTVVIKNAEVTVDNATIENAHQGGFAVQVSGGAEGLWGSAAINNSIVKASGVNGTGIAVFGPQEAERDTSSLAISGNTQVQGGQFGIAGNGTWHGTSIEVESGATVTGGHHGIYHPQDGTLTVGGTVTGGETGIEMRSGELVVNGGSITGNGAVYSCDPNGNGITTKGAAIAIAQHTTKQNISVTINGGTFAGIVALSESNPQENDPAPQVSLTVRGGTFNGRLTVADAQKFITGGTFNSGVDAGYIADGYELSGNTVVSSTAGGGTVTPPVTDPDNPGEEIEDPDTPLAPGAMNFDDVKDGDWFYNELLNVYNQGIVNGVGGTDLFNPYGTTTRAQLVTMLYRMEGEPKVDPADTFYDTRNDSFYHYAAAWAKQNGIVHGDGNTGLFMPFRNITREQLGAILYRYAEYKGYDLTPSKDLTGFNDGAAVSNWAKESMAWAAGTGVIRGDGNTGLLNPKNDSTRAQMVVMLDRFLKDVVPAEGEGSAK